MVSEVFDDEDEEQPAASVTTATTATSAEKTANFDFIRSPWLTVRA
jgi:hypothetical protein